MKGQKSSLSKRPTLHWSLDGVNKNKIELLLHDIPLYSLYVLLSRQVSRTLFYQGLEEPSGLMISGTRHGS